MPRGRINLHGRTKAVPVVTFRVSADERSGLEADAAAAGCAVNELARRRALRLDDSMSTENRDAGRHTVYDEGERAEEP